MFDIDLFLFLDASSAPQSVNEIKRLRVSLEGSQLPQLIETLGDEALTLWWVDDLPGRSFVKAEIRCTERAAYDAARERIQKKFLPEHISEDW